MTSFLFAFRLLLLAGCRNALLAKTKQNSSFHSSQRHKSKVRSNFILPETRRKRTAPCLQHVSPDRDMHVIREVKNELKLCNLRRTVVSAEGRNRPKIVILVFQVIPDSKSRFFDSDTLATFSQNRRRELSFERRQMASTSAVPDSCDGMSLNSVLAEVEGERLFRSFLTASLALENLLFEQAVAEFCQVGFGQVYLASVRFVGDPLIGYSPIRLSLESRSAFAQNPRVFLSTARCRSTWPGFWWRGVLWSGWHFGSPGLLETI